MHDEASVEASPCHSSPCLGRIELFVGQLEGTLREARQCAYELPLDLQRELRRRVMRPSSKVFEPCEGALR